MKIKKKAMNKIQNEMRRRFGPYWERKAGEIGQLQRAVVQLQKEVRDLNEFKAATLRAEASKGDTGKHVAKPEPETAPRPAVWEASFHVYGGNATRTINISNLRALKRVGIETVSTAINGNHHYVRVQLLPTRFPGRIEALEEQLRRLLDAPVRVHWRKVQ